MHESVLLVVREGLDIFFSSAPAMCIAFCILWELQGLAGWPVVSEQREHCKGGKKQGS